MICDGNCNCAPANTVGRENASLANGAEALTAENECLATDGHKARQQPTASTPGPDRKFRRQRAAAPQRAVCRKAGPRTQEKLKRTGPVYVCTRAVLPAREKWPPSVEYRKADAGELRWQHLTC